MLKSFKTLDFENEEVQALQNHIQQWAQQFNKYPSIAVGSDRIRLQRPAFKSTGNNIVTISGSTALPIVAIINGVIQRSTDNILINMGLTGFGGLDAGAIAADTNYYVYLVMKGDILGAIASKNAPTTQGPTGFPLWSYIGSFLTNSTPAVPEFIFYDGHYHQWPGSSSQDVSTSSTTPVAKTLLIPAYARSVIGRLLLNGAVVANDDGTVGPTSTTMLIVQRAASTVDELDLFRFPVFESRTIYLNVQNAATALTFRLLGWDETPTEFQ